MLLKSSVLQEAIFNSVNFSSIATDENGIIQIFNVGAEQMLGYNAQELINKVSPSTFSDQQELVTRAEMLSNEYDAVIKPGFEALVFKASRGIEDIYELTYLCKDGSRLPALVSVTALRNADNAIIGYLLIGTDNTARKHIEAERSEKAEELLLAKAAADQANLAKSDFLSGMSHELRTPLSAILGFAQLLETSTPAPTVSQQRSIDQILKAGWYLLTLINEILDLAQIESGKMSVSLESIKLAPLLQECQIMIEPEAERLELSLDFPVIDNSVLVYADQTRIKQVLINLLSNALKYNIPQGKVTVSCEMLADQRLRLCVRDTGRGLNPRQLSQLFQPFNRLGQESIATEGTGIGLVMTQRLVELMGGQLGVESEVGKGSMFWIELKTMTAAEATAATDQLLPEEDAAVVGALRFRSLLYVEDNPANMLLVQDLVARRSDIQLLSASDGKTGMEMALATIPDVILMDINLPDRTGTSVMIELGKDPLTAHIPVIALSANAMPHDVYRGLQDGFYRYITKPIRIGEFLDTLDLAFSRADELQRARAEQDQAV